MTSALKIIKFELRDVVRSKWIVVYTLFFFLLTDSLFRFGGSSAKVLLSLINAVLLIIPLMSIIFGVMYLYHSREFIEMMLSQPINRKTLFGGLYSGLAAPLSLGFVTGVGLPFAIHGLESPAHLSILLTLLVTGVFLTFVFIALAFLISILYEDRTRGLGIAILSWLLFSVIYDGFILLVIYWFGDYPLEKPVIALSMLNPIDLGRILLILQFDIAALMGYTGAVFQKFFGSLLGMLIAFLTLMLWTVVPFALGLKCFKGKDF